MAFPPLYRTRYMNCSCPLFVSIMTSLKTVSFLFGTCLQWRHNSGLRFCHTPSLYKQPVSRLRRPLEQMSYSLVPISTWMTQAQDFSNTYQHTATSLGRTLQVIKCESKKWGKARQINACNPSWVWKPRCIGKQKRGEWKPARFFV